MKSLVPVLLLGAVLVALVFAARCTQQKMHEYETRGAESAGPEAASADPNSAPNELAERERMAREFPDTLLSTSGLRFKILREGSGPKPIAGSTVVAHYRGRLLDGTVFDNSYARGQPFEFRLMAGAVIRGWDHAFLDMREGEQRLIVIPSSLAYGERGRPPTIPPRATLIFEVELLDIR